MRDVLGESLRKLKRFRKRKNWISAALMLLSLAVVLDVFWTLRQPALTKAGDAACGIVEHTHSEACRQQICICDCAEEGHRHEDACYETTVIAGYEETVLICEDTSELHEHTQSCYQMNVVEDRQEQVLTCGLSEEGHIHDDACYEWEWICDLEEHIHSISCYSDETADVETPLDWQAMFAAYPYTGDLRQDLVGIARTQVGYAESERNFAIDRDGVRRGYTRYGAWYGAPYADWSAMFVSFCLHYAGADPAQAPGNTGAESMATIWNGLGKLAQAGDYVPIAGDLVFFSGNRVGIVSDVQNATFYVIQGDLDGSVCNTMLSLSDASIIGWGTTAGTAPVSADHPEPTEAAEATEAAEEENPKPAIPTEEELLDISGGPAVFIFEGGSSGLQPQRFAFRMSRTVTDLISYLKDHNGDYNFTLLDTNNKELPKDDKGNYIVKPGISYKLTLTVTNPDGFLPGTYQYQVVDGLQVNGGTGSFILTDGTNVGDWEVTDEGLITMQFNEHMNSRTDITISATMGIMFSEQDEPMDFDGKITVTVEKPTHEEVTTKLSKWGSQGKEDEEEDPTRIYWTMEIIGQRDSQIPGSVITDQIKTGVHRYTQSDIDGGLRFGVGEYDLETGEQVAWHAWDVAPDDPNLNWTENGWTYTIPETVRCKWCPEPITLGNDGWIYYVEYTSTPEVSDRTGAYWYTNSATVDGQYAEGWGSFSHGEGQAGIIKNGSFHGDAEGGAFIWELQATVPGRKSGEKAVYLWTVMDYMRVKDKGNNTVGYIDNGILRGTITATNQGQTYTVPEVKNATTKDPFAWYNEWSVDHGGVVYGPAIYLMCRCHCTEENCQFWENGKCISQCWYEADDGLWYSNGFCYCWTEEEDTTFTFSYETDDLSVIENYGGQNYDLQNEAVLQNTVYQPDGTPSTSVAGDTRVNVPVPGVFKKELTHDFDGYTAHYTITVNESKLTLTGGSPLTIHDEMTQTLAFISGSLVITTEDANGNTAVLRQGTDYTVTYDGSGTAKDDAGAPVHVLDIVILRPQPVMYVLDYDATLIIPPGTTQAVKYNNSATITLWGQDMTDESEEKVYADINIAAKSYRVEIHKKDMLTGEPLGGATFGLFNDQGGLISTEVSDAAGDLLFETNIIQGIILREHVLYYLQEMQAPPGYQLDDTKYWFCFCGNTGDSCDACDSVLAQVDGFRIPFEQIGKVTVENEYMSYDLPATGGSGIYPTVLVSVMLILTPLVYGFIRRRKQERRGVG